MKITLAWLSEFIDLQSLFDLDEVLTAGPSRPGVLSLVDAMNELGMVVEGVEHAPASLDGVVVGQVVSLEAIPGADKIRATLVDDGQGEPKSVVCGAWNFQVGDKVPWAPPGVTLPTGMTLSERRMRGVTSLGMLCSPIEVGVSTEAGGLLVLDAVTPVGVSFAQHFEISDDIVIDLAIEANRPDANCVLGVARDLSAWLQVPFCPPALPQLEVAVTPSPRNDPAACDRLMVARLTGVAQARFELKRARRLRLAGMRSISPVVDASNYVMLELGQPTHPYDVETLADGEIAARFGRAGEEVVTLDGATRVLETDDVVIVDGVDQAVGLAGVMGGLSTEVSADTSTVLLEAAHFPAARIARTAKRLNLRSEASGRFERGTDPEILTSAIARIAELAHLGLDGPIRELANAVGALPTIEVRPERVVAMLGHDDAEDLLRVLQANGPLEQIGFRIERSAERYLVTPPSFRPDVTTEIEVIEEIARHFGYQRLPSTPLVVRTRGGLTPRQRLLRELKVMLAGMGLFEAWSVTLVSPEEQVAAGGSEDPIRLIDPLAAQESELRETVLAGLLRSVRTNVARRLGPVKLFEVGPVMSRSPSSDEVLPNECLRLGVVVEDPVNGLIAIAPVLGALGRLFGIESRLITRELREYQPGWPHLHPSRASGVFLDSEMVGVVGELHPAQIPDELLHLVGGRFGYLELDLAALIATMEPITSVVVPTVYTASDLDLSFAIPVDFELPSLLAAVREEAGSICTDLTIFDRFAPVDNPGQVYIGIRLRLESQAGVIADETVRGLIDSVDQRATSLGARLRKG